MEEKKTAEELAEKYRSDFEIEDSRKKIEAKLGISIRGCRECETMNCAMRCMRALQFRHSNGNVGLTGEVNFRNAISFDHSTQEIIVSEELLMQAIMIANPGQKRRRIRLASESEFEKYNHIPQNIKDGEQK